MQHFPLRYAFLWLALALRFFFFFGLCQRGDEIKQNLCTFIFFLFCAKLNRIRWGSYVGFRWTFPQLNAKCCSVYVIM